MNAHVVVTAKIKRDELIQCSNYGFLLEAKFFPFTGKY